MPPITDESRIVRQGVVTPRHITPFGWMFLICGVLAMALAGCVAALLTTWRMQ